MKSLAAHQPILKRKRGHHPRPRRKECGNCGQSGSHTAADCTRPSKPKFQPCDESMNTQLDWLSKEV
jgi:hypothetical protein